ncbi:MAG: magnesium transporter [Actinobacteria bacterium]|nr:magnesium transporter [Actinomycetota bacterium]
MLRLLRFRKPEIEGLGQAGAALSVATLVSFVAGFTLGRIQGILEELPGLLVLVPAAIGMRGNIYGALASRLGTAMHTGTWTSSRRADTVVGQNIAASLALSLATSLVLAVLAKSVAVAFGLGSTLGILDLAVISVLAGFASSLVLLTITVALSGASVRRGWDMDNVAAPLVTAAGDVVTLPALALATLAVGHRVVTPVIGALVVIAAVGAPWRAWRTGHPLLRRIMAESIPVLLVAGTLNTVAGAVFETRLARLLALPALLMLIPPFLASTGALGGILAARVGSKLHLGTVLPQPWPGHAARKDMILVSALRVPTLLAIGVLAHVGATLSGLGSPGLGAMVAVTAIAGVITMLATLMVAWYGSIAAYRVGLDPDNHGIPLVSSTMDLFGAVAIVIAIAVVGLG